MPRYLSIASEFIKNPWVSALFKELLLGSSFQKAAEVANATKHNLRVPGMQLAEDSTGKLWLFAVNEKRLRIVADGDSGAEVMIWQEPGRNNVIRVEGTALEQYFK